MRERIVESVKGSIQAVEQLLEERNLKLIQEMADLLAESFRNRKKLIIAGNGGSLCDAAHFAEELTGLFRTKRSALPAIALTDPGHITCTANDMGFDQVFARGVEAYGNPGDVFVGLSTSGNSQNIVNAFEEAKSRGLKTVAFLGKQGGKLKGYADLELIIEEFDTSDRIQEAHMAAIHIVIEMVELELFSAVLN